MLIYPAKNLGFCFGVKKALELAEHDFEKPVRTYGEIIHNEAIVKKLAERGISSIDGLSELSGGTLIIRTHGAPREVTEEAQKKGLKVIDATCPFVKKIHGIVEKHYADGYKIVIIGKDTHPEVIGINSVCGYSAVVFDAEDIPESVYDAEKACFVAQTTFSADKFANIVKNIRKDCFKTVEIFDTICYTTLERQSEAARLAEKCDVMLVIGSSKSSNTVKLKEICEARCAESYLIGGVEDIKKIKIKVGCKIGIVAGASTPIESATEVIHYMSDTYTDAQNEEFLQAVDAVGETRNKLKDGKRMRVKVTFADEKGITVHFGSKVDGFIPADEASLDGSYKPEDYAEGSDIEAILTNSKVVDGVYLFSKKKVDKIKEGDKIVDTIRNGELFELVVEKETKGGLIGKLGTYTVFIPASQIKEKYVHDLAHYVAKTLRLVVIEINDETKRIVATQKKVLEEEKKLREETFWANVVPGVVVNGKVKGISKFGAFVSVDGFDCLVHISDIAWTKFKSIEDIIKVGKKYDFVVLKADQEKGKVSLGYKQLQKHPFDVAIETYPVGSVVSGKVTSIMPFGLFVEIVSGVEGLVHVSEASRQFVKDLNESFKIGDEVEVKLLGVDAADRKITLSIKACLPEDPDSEKPQQFDKKESKPRASRKREESKSDTEWSETDANNPFADLADLLKKQ